LSATAYGFALSELAAWPETADSERKSALTSKTFIVTSLAGSHCKYFISREPDAAIQEFVIVWGLRESMRGYAVFVLG
jgi:hypothetical protein